MKKIKKFRIITASLTILMLVSLTGLFILQQSNRSLHTRLDSEKLKSEALLSEKLLMQKSRDKNALLNKALQDDLVNLDEQLRAKTEVISTQIAENNRIKRTLRLVEQNSKKNSSLNEALRNKLSATEIALQNLDSLKALTSDSLYESKKELVSIQEELEQTIKRSIDQTLITGLKKNGDKVTARAKAIQQLVATVMVPGLLSDLAFVVEGPGGSVLSDDNGSLTAKLIENDQTLTASVKENMYSELQPQQIQITYLPKQKLKPGTYTFKIFNKTKYVGSMKVKLR